MIEANLLGSSPLSAEMQQPVVNNGGGTPIDLRNYVKKTTTIAGIDLQDNITISELINALGLKQETLTQEEYDTLDEIDNDTTYFIVEE